MCVFTLAVHHPVQHVLTHSFPARRSSRLFVIRPARHLALRRSMRPQNPTYPSLGHLDRQISSYLIDTAPSSRGAQKFPFAASCRIRSEEHTSELQSLMRISYAVF